MVLYCRVPLNVFVESFRNTLGPNSFFTLPAKGLTHIVPQEEIKYGFSLFRESIGLYEERKGIPVGKSKKTMPFFGQDSRMLVGPEIGMYVILLYEKPGEPARSAEPSLVLELNRQSLGKLCLFENYSPLSCKYEKEPILNHFTAQLKEEYDTFFFDEEHTGFTPDSHFFSMLRNTCLEVKQPSLVGGKEWRLVSLQATDEVLYRYEHGSLVPYVPISMPVDCLKRVCLEDLRRQPLLFGTLNDFLKSRGPPTEQLLSLSQGTKTVSNQELTIRVSEHGTELSNIVANATGKEYLWQADPVFQRRYSPVLFPIVGSVRKAEYRDEGTVYPLSQYGFVRDMDFTLIDEAENELRFALESTPDTLRAHLFPFLLEIGYRLEGNKVEVLRHVKNTGDKTMHFQIGAHPAFLCPNYEVDQSDRGYLVFDVRKDLVYRALVEKGCVGDVIRPVPLDADGLPPLNIHTSGIDTFVLEDSQIKRVDLLDVEKRPYLSLTFTASVVSLWSPPTRNAPFVCIGPWYGRCDRVDYTGEYKDRDWVWHLEPGELPDASYTIEVAGA